MGDKFSKRTRSSIMSKIKSKNTSIEILFRKLLCKNGLRGYKIHYSLPGKPDIAYVSKRIAIFIDVDFGMATTGKSSEKFRLKNIGRQK